MPCFLCNAIYKDKPCESNEIKIIDKPCENYNKKYLIKYFELIHDNCPCINCVVRIVCENERLNCPEYLTLLSDIKLQKEK